MIISIFVYFGWQEIQDENFYKIWGRKGVLCFLILMMNFVYVFEMLDFVIDNSIFQDNVL